MWRILKGISNGELKGKLRVSDETLRKLKTGTYTGNVEAALKVAVLTQGAVSMLDLIPRELLDSLVEMAIRVREETRQEGDKETLHINAALIPQKKMVWEV